MHTVQDENRRALRLWVSDEMGRVELVCEHALKVVEHVASLIRAELADVRAARESHDV